MRNVRDRAGRGGGLVYKLRHKDTSKDSPKERPMR